MMTAATPATLAANSSARPFDPVRARVRCEPLTTNAERLQEVEAARIAAQPRKPRTPSGVALLRETRVGRYVQSLHPGDVVYWIAGLGGACLLLIKATI